MSPVRNLRAWLITILRNFYLNSHARRQGRVRLWVSGEEEHVLTPALAPPQPDVVALQELWRALAALPDPQREALLLVSVEGLSYEEAADVLEVPIGTVRSRISRARSKLLSLSGEG